MKIYLAADHAGFALKEAIKKHLKGQGLTVEDQGAFALDPEDDYTDYVKIVAKLIQSEPESRGIVLGGSGQGEAIAANRFAGVRAVVYYGGPEEIIKLSRQHNDANVLSLGARFINETEALSMVDLWLTTDFSNDERHRRRLRAIDDQTSSGRLI
ncbi:MAG: ribose-5-phosphate isomerase [Candidatus Vogelbacteria bacterium CG10_big_fil_rev_8_21_14_0_10_49_38]|uniref:Ribose-5-phosphate isomerase n=1 Tax=Candidatus Vogelbacteria bacterium CG10_big_fil_rev_8_21_14_0_10_49_38 TaxID=1975043 RepID=A0A2H0RI02_9BACT|nr:MAG: ribose-5-phosphate isomerase [bacterium CG10_49_38]PIR46087.1 MAG: ribose-5-phosphate isomerase [Candidatus Vogelbacteria bacterium CG10_big_fil_rev_8_21_14_0_10_49_38]